MNKNNFAFYIFAASFRWKKLLVFATWTSAFSTSVLCPAMLLTRRSSLGRSSLLPYASFSFLCYVFRKYSWKSRRSSTWIVRSSLKMLILEYFSMRCTKGAWHHFKCLVGLDIALDMLRTKVTNTFYKASRFLKNSGVKKWESKICQITLFQDTRNLILTNVYF